MLTAPRPLRIALLSCAHTHAAGYAALLDARGDVDLVVSDPDGFGDVHVSERSRLVGSHEEALDAWADGSGAADGAAASDGRGGVSGPDAVVVTSANAHHRDLVLEAARRGAHVLCEKPLATTVADAEQMVAACREAGVLLMTAFPVHFAPQVAALREAVAHGSLGEVVGVTGTNNGKLPTGRDWFTDVGLSGGGALVDHTVHIAQILDSVFGEPESVHAVTNRILYADRAGEGAETGGLVTLTYPDGLVATIDCSWSQPAEAPTWGGVTLQAVGTEGQLVIDPFSQHVGGFGQWLPYGADLDALMLEAFLGGVRARADGTGARPDGAAGPDAPALLEPSGETGLRTVRVVAAAQESVATGQPVALAALRGA
ncbi:Gfo/Idh/MocA family oxidoreductase [Brachybacterium halotolerans subsp. kimchii]|uniref:Gfo/Idh/MocA family protein n=1 Tax=Brachybacterium halotolerans TaxID=2795215 RepID=UPI001E3B1EF4|nr:Gfo/Idh/MocA family oxidoreductase [Brachybacterium halotolerans]UEJ81485.1 Gfo/Idh/MocA family oxidoreductase [Brachybacterium halotolerans subsp. kimchii]